MAFGAGSRHWSSSHQVECCIACSAGHEKHKCKAVKLCSPTESASSSLEASENSGIVAMALPGKLFKSFKDLWRHQIFIAQDSLVPSAIHTGDLDEAGFGDLQNRAPILSVLNPGVQNFIFPDLIGGFGDLQCSNSQNQKDRTGRAIPHWHRSRRSVALDQVMQAAIRDCNFCATWVVFLRWT